MFQSRRTLGILVLAVLAVSAGCASTISDDPNPERIADQIQQRMEKIDSVQGTKVMRITTDGETNTTVTNYVRQPPTKIRSEVVEGSGYQSEGDLRVNTGEATYNYDASENTYSKYDFDTGQSSQFPNAEAIDRLLNRSNVSYVGADTVAGRDVHIIEIVRTERDSTTTLKVDQEYWYPLALETTSSYNGTETTLSWTHRNVTFNEPVADDVFTFDPPAGAELKTSHSPEMNKYDSVQAADDATPYAITEPAVPAEYSLDTTQVMVFNGTSTASLTYKDGKNRIYFTITNESRSEASGESVAIGNTTGTVSSYGASTTVTWDCDGLQYSLSGQLNQSTLVDAATTVGCH